MVDDFFSQSSNKSIVTGFLNKKNGQCGFPTGRFCCFTLLLGDLQFA
jgi:hypothetical protein